jgi:anti-sigma factor RsiW
MNPSRDVIRDLLPLYVAGEASPDTVKLVEEALAGDPALAAEEAVLRRADPSAVPGPVRAPDHDRVALQRIREAVRERSLLLALAIFLTLVPFAFLYTGGQVKFLVLRDAPTMGMAALVAAGACWVGWFLLGRRIGRMA